MGTAQHFAKSVNGRVTLRKGYYKCMQFKLNLSQTSKSDDLLLIPTLYYNFKYFQTKSTNLTSCWNGSFVNPRMPCQLEVLPTKFSQADWGLERLFGSALDRVFGSALDRRRGSALRGLTAR